jgi:hypothetical protein
MKKTNQRFFETVTVSTIDERSVYKKAHATLAFQLSVR